IPNGNLGMNENNIQNIGAIQDGGSNAITVDNSQNVKIPNGRLYVGPNRLWVDPYSEYGSWQNDGATINTAISTNIVAGQSDNRRNINFGVGGDNISETTIGLHLNGQGDGSGSPADSVDVNIPNGALTVSGDLAVGGTECNTGEFLDGDGTCTSVTGTTNDDYVSEGGDSMTGYLNMTGSPVVNVGANNIDVGDGQGNIDMNGQRILDSSLMVADNIGVTGSASTADTETNGNDVYVQDDVKVDGDFVGAGADVAERLKTEEKIPSATVVELGANMSVEVSDSARDTAVAGVVSRDPAMIMAKERDGVPIAMSGTVPVKFSDENGGVKPGDFLTTASEDGHAMKCSNLDRCEGAIIGKAMESQAKDGEVQMMVSRG
ncbi:MAG: hypothetical protein ABEJ03_03550, partial [Candidatus Nanohaloarchaea archaeon]